MENIENNQVTQEPQPVQPTPPIKNNNIFKYLFIASIILLLGVIIGFYFLLNNKIKQLENKQVTNTTPTVEEISTIPTKTETTPTVEKEVKPTTSLNNTTNSWQTYTNSNYGLSFKYPSDWIGQPNETKSGPIQHLFSFTTSPDKSFFQGYLGASVGIMLIGYQGSPTDWYKDNIDLGPFTTASPAGPIYESKNLTINGYKTFYVKQITDSYTDNNYILSNGKNYIVYVSFRESDKHYSTNGVIDETNDYTKYLSEFNQIVNSIKFN